MRTTSAICTIPFERETDCHRKSDKLLAILFQQGLHLVHTFLAYRNQAMPRTVEIRDDRDHYCHEQRQQ